VGARELQAARTARNDGNTPDNYSRVELAVRTYNNVPIDTFSADILTTVPPFTRQQVCVDVPHTLSPGTRTHYWANHRSRAPAMT